MKGLRRPAGRCGGCPVAGMQVNKRMAGREGRQVIPMVNDTAQFMPVGQGPVPVIGPQSLAGKLLWIGVEVTQRLQGIRPGRAA